MVQGKKEYLKAFVLQKYVPAECVERVSHVVFLRGIKSNRFSAFLEPCDSCKDDSYQNYIYDEVHF